MGLIVSVYRDADTTTDCTNNGISRRFTRLCVVNASGPFEPRHDCPPVLLERHPGGAYKTVRLVPAVTLADGTWAPASGWYMMGGNYASTSDSRLGDLVRRLLDDPILFYGAVPIHDRQE